MRADHIKNISDFINNKTFSLIGIGVSNIPLIPFLYKYGAKEVICRDLKLNPESENAKIAVSYGAKLILGDEYLKDLNEDIIIRSPAVRPDKPELLKSIALGKELYCETDLFLRFCPYKTIAVTGSDGKTTTTTLIYEILKKEGYDVILGGNIGKNLLTQLDDTHKENTVAVIELSSFQLFQSKYASNVSIITNIAPNHLDWHINMDEYISSKLEIFNNQKNDSISIINYDNNCLNESLKENNIKGKKRYFSSTENNNIGAYYKDNAIFYNNGKSIIKIINTNDILLPGFHNIVNLMAAICATIDLVSIDSIVEVAKSFKGVEHRIEFVRELNKIKFYNSSIDSSPTRTVAALKSFDRKVILIAGGYDKNLDYSPLSDIINERVKLLILCGKTSDKIEAAVKSSKLYDDSFCIIKTECFETAVETAYKKSDKNDIVLLSPASASFDMFKNFEDRGNTFKRIVMELK